MAFPFRKYGFATAVAGVLALAVAAVAIKAIAPASGKAGSPSAGAGPASAPPGAGGRGGGEAPLVEVASVQSREFADTVEALGTAQARESVVITAKVTDVIRAIRFDSGDRVQKGQVLVVLSNVEQQADLSEARAALASQEREFNRFKDLGEKGFAPKARVEQAQAAYEQAVARVSALESRISDRTIRAPFSGVMGLRTASPGTLARPGEPIATLDDDSVIKLDFDVPETQLSRIRSGVSIVAQTAALPGREFPGQIDDVDSRIDPATRTLKVRALLDNASRVLKPGMLMTVQIRSNPRQALAVPDMAVIEQLDGASVFKVVEKDGKTVAARAKIKLGQRGGGFIEVVSGLSAGDRIVVEGVQRARPGQPVRVEAAAPAPATTAGGPAARL